MHKPKVLIIEDDLQMAETLQSIVRLIGYDTILAHNSRQALSLALREWPDLILLDINLPDVDGFEVCRYLKQETDLKETPIIIISVENHPEAVQRALQAGAARYLIKPVGIDDLETAIAEVIAE